MITVLWWGALFGGIAGLLIILKFNDPSVEQAEELLDEIDEESRHI